MQSINAKCGCCKGIGWFITGTLLFVIGLGSLIIGVVEPTEACTVVESFTPRQEPSGQWVVGVKAKFSHFDLTAIDPSAKCSLSADNCLNNWYPPGKAIRCLYRGHYHYIVVSPETNTRLSTFDLIATILGSVVLLAGAVCLYVAFHIYARSQQPDIHIATEEVSLLV